MKLVIKGGTIVTGDGSTVIYDGVVVIEGGIITELADTKAVVPEGTQTIDATGQVIMPGIINNHAHAVIDGAPLFASGTPPLTSEQTFSHLDRHLLQGTTTILNVDGFATIEQVENTNCRHPINLKTGTIHTPKNIKAAYMADGKGMKPENEKITAEEMVRKGAVALAEVGAGATLGGGVQDYLFIPRAIREVTGIELSAPQANALKLAVVGKYIMPPVFDKARTANLMNEFKLTDKITIETLKKLIEDTVLPSFEDAIAGLVEAGKYAQRLGIPVSIHHAAPTKEVTKKMAYLGPLLVAGHSNHGSFDTEESVRACRWLKAKDVIIDVSTLDTFGARQLVPNTDNLYSLIRENLVDTISTDYAGGNWDAISVCLDYLVKDSVCSLPSAVSMATGNVARLFPGLAPKRGVIAVGNVADIILVDDGNLGKVNMVIVEGKVVVEHGKTCY
jgi:imidazolonepropionase-like amidohydrolase